MVSQLNSMMICYHSNEFKQATDDDAALDDNNVVESKGKEREHGSLPPVVSQLRSLTPCCHS